MAAKIKKGDKVIVTTGRDKGKQGEVLKVFPDEGRAIVQGCGWSSGTSSRRRATRKVAS